MAETYTSIEFNYATFSLLPYSKNNGSSSTLLKSIINKLNEEDFPSEKKVIDKHENRTKSVKRRLVIISTHLGKEGRRCFGKIALIKNKAPLLWGGQDLIEEIQKVENKEFIEITNFVIHFSDSGDPIVMFEFNSEGPRLSDIEFYLRQIASEFHIAKKIQSILHLKTEYENLDRQLGNVFNLTVKVSSGNTTHANWLRSLNTINNEIGYKDVRLELFFNRQKEATGKYIRNIRATDYARDIISWLRKDRKNIEYIEDLKMSYQVDSNDEIIDLDFLKNKRESLVRIPNSTGTTYTNRDFK